MFLPIGDHPNPPRAQWVTRILLGINVAVHVFWSYPLSTQPLTEADLRDAAVMRVVHEMHEQYAPNKSPVAFASTLSRYEVYVRMYGYVPARPTLAGLFVCMFLHGGWMHLFGNMLYLWIFGDNVEARLGKIGYVFAYLATGVVATLAFALPNRDSLVPLVGASGAISGVLGLYLVWFPHNLIRVFVWLFVFIQVFFIRAYWVLLIYLIVDNLLMPYLLGGSGGVAHAAHIGGFLAGMVVAWTFDRVRGTAPAPRPEYGPGPQPFTYRPAGARDRPRPDVDHGMTFHKSIRAGNMREAAHAFARLVREGGGTPEPGDVFRLAYWLYEHNYVADAVAVFRFYIRNFPRGHDLDRVHLGLGILLARRMGQPAAAREHILTAIDLSEDPALTETAKAELEKL